MSPIPSLLKSEWGQKLRMGERGELKGISETEAYLWDSELGSADRNSELGLGSADRRAQS